MNELEREIRKYKLDDLLFLFAELSRELFGKKAFLKQIEWKRYIGKYLAKKEQSLPAFGLADLSYIAIRNSNDYRKCIPKMEDVYRLNNFLAGVSNDEAKSKLDSISPQGMRTHILLGLPQKQFWYQHLLRGKAIYYNFLRYYILLCRIPPFLPNHRLPNNDLIEITGFDIQTFSQLLLMIYTYNICKSAQIREIKVTEDLREKIPVITEANLMKCLNFFMEDYRYYRNFSIPTNPLFLKLIIKTDTNKIIISNSFIWARKFYEGIYWLIRYKYMKDNSQAFINNFGKYYERYVQDILEYYLEPNQFEKIKPSEGIKSADWLVYSTKYILVVEQKSCLMTIALKNEYPPLEKLDEYLLQNFKEAYTQIANTVKSISSSKKTIINLILHFETFYLGEAIIKERVNQLCRDEIDDLSNYFFVDTEEFEKLIQAIADDEGCFNKIIEKKIVYESNNVPISAGKEFHYLIDELAGIKEIRYLEQYKEAFESLFPSI